MKAFFDNTILVGIPKLICFVFILQYYLVCIPETYYKVFHTYKHMYTLRKIFKNHVSFGIQCNFT